MDVPKSTSFSQRKFLTYVLFVGLYVVGGSGVFHVGNVFELIMIAFDAIHLFVCMD